MKKDKRAPALRWRDQKWLVWILSAWTIIGYPAAVAITDGKNLASLAPFLIPAGAAIAMSYLGVSGFSYNAKLKHGGDGK